jgi:hypothetical protein
LTNGLILQKWWAISIKTFLHFTDKKNRKIAIVKSEELPVVFFFIAENLPLISFCFYLGISKIQSVYPKSISMKRNAQSTFYFSAYPLKALQDEASAKPSQTLSQTQSPYLKAILSGKTRTLSRVRVFPMINPYRKNMLPVIPDENKLIKDIELVEKEWFNNYE